MQGLRSGQVPFQLAHNGMTPWEVLKDSDRCAKVFDQSMSEVSRITGNAVVTDYDWGRYEQVVDVGGGVGELTAELLGDHPKLQGVVFDQEQQIERAKEVRARLAGVCLQGHMYCRVLPRCDCLAHVSHSISPLFAGHALQRGRLVGEMPSL